MRPADVGWYEKFQPKEFPRGWPEYWEHPIGSFNVREKTGESVEIIGHRLIRGARSYLVRGPSGNIFDLHPWNLVNNPE